MRQPTEESFLNDVKDHGMSVIVDDGLRRHIRFAKPGSGNMHFDLITWPGHLCYTGDMGTYVFQRLDDMFMFFRTDRRDKAVLGINPSYWREKLTSVDRNAGIEEFDDECFNRAVMDDLIQWIRDHRDETSKDERRDLWEAVVSEVIEASGNEGGWRKFAAAHDFFHYVNDETGNFEFTDFGEHDVTEYTYHYLWCCYAIAWGVLQYDQSMTDKKPWVTGEPI